MCILISAVLTLSLAACSDTEPAPVDMEPKTSQMKAICELAVMDCYYHNVAKYEMKDAEGFLWWTKDKNCWIEYSGQSSNSCADSERRRTCQRTTLVYQSGLDRYGAQPRRYERRLASLY